ncbi:glycosyltransferase family 2 protein [Bacillota bacterium LCP21S3_A4]
MKISIISVCRNCVQDVDQTISSVLKQLCTDYEYIVIDGASSDGTYGKVCSYKGAFQTRGIRFTTQSEPDSGIYNAMNKGINIASGEYILFLNMGDSLIGESVLKEIIPYLNGENVVYGDCKMKGMPYLQKWHLSFFNSVYRELALCHQTIFAPSCLLKKRGFDEAFPVCADREWVIYCLMNKETFDHVPVLICDYKGDGVSSNYMKYQEDSLRVSQKYGGVKAKIIILVKRIVGKILKHI